jgi:hypothetical protein
MERRPDDDSARPEQVEEEGFAEGAPEPAEPEPGAGSAAAEEERGPNFARGLSDDPEHERARPDFARGIDDPERYPEDTEEGDFAEGTP